LEKNNLVEMLVTLQSYCWCVCWQPGQFRGSRTPRQSDSVPAVFNWLFDPTPISRPW